MAITKEEAAAALNRNEYRCEGSDELFQQMRDSRLVAVFGASDDITMFAGAAAEEEYLGEFFIDDSGLMKSQCEEGQNCPYFERLIDKAAMLETGFDGRSGFWVKTSIPHACFVILEDGEQYGEGIVFSLDGLA